MTNEPYAVCPGDAWHSSSGAAREQPLLPVRCILPVRRGQCAAAWKPAATSTATPKTQTLHYPLWYFEDQSRGILTSPSLKPIFRCSLYLWSPRSYNKIRLFHNNITWELLGGDFVLRMLKIQAVDADRRPFRVLIVIELFFYGSYGTHSHRMHTVTDNTQFRKWHSVITH